MKEIKKLTTTQIRIFPPDTIPFPRVLLEEHREALRSMFKFQVAEPFIRDEVIQGLRLSLGIYAPESTMIEHIDIEERRILLKVEGNSKAAFSIYDEIRKKLEQLHDQKPIEEIICTHETESSVELDVPFERVFATSFLSFLEKSEREYIQNRWSKAFIVPAHLNFNVRYQITDENLVKHNIALASKRFIIEPRRQTAVEDNLYFIASPTDTETHLKLVQDLERGLAAG